MRRKTAKRFKRTLQQGRLNSNSSHRTEKQPKIHQNEALPRGSGELFLDALYLNTCRN